MATRKPRQPSQRPPEIDPPYQGPKDTVRPLDEQGAPGFSSSGGYIVTAEKSPEAQGLRKYTNAADILSNYDVVAASLRYFLNLVARPKWVFEPADKSDAAKQAADFMEEVVTSMEIGWPRAIRKGAMYRFYGFSLQEWIATKRSDGRIGLKTIEARPQFTIEKWDTDTGGSVLGACQVRQQDYAQLYLPREKLIYYVDDAMADGPEGMGWFRNLLEPAKTLREYLRLERVGFQRDLSGIPIGKAPLTQIDRAVRAGTITKAEGEAMIEAIKKFVRLEVKMENTGMVIDSQPFESTSADGKNPTGTPQWGVELLTGSSTSAAAIGAAIDRLSLGMARIMGTESIMMHAAGSAGGGLAKDKSKALAMNVNSTTRDMAKVIDTDLTRPIFDLNGFDPEIAPRAKVEDVAFREIEEVTRALADLASAGAVLDPEDEAINDVRDLIGLSRADLQKAAAYAASLGNVRGGAEAGKGPAKGGKGKAKAKPGADA